MSRSHGRGTPRSEASSVAHLVGPAERNHCSNDSLRPTTHLLPEQSGGQPSWGSTRAYHRTDAGCATAPFRMDKSSRSSDVAGDWYTTMTSKIPTMSRPSRTWTAGRIERRLQEALQSYVGRLVLLRLQPPPPVALTVVLEPTLPPTGTGLASVGGRKRPRTPWTANLDGNTCPCQTTTASCATYRLQPRNSFSP